ncbi:uncharacterized protein METZ01_LOCUS171091 [marine metagenome]|uniref:Uncharacterized protein n=1 Tax=marine metagenome TaxID=408172 RepID=A0A382BYG6_9ZZZZ
MGEILKQNSSANSLNQFYQLSEILRKIIYGGKSGVV